VRAWAAESIWWIAQSRDTSAAIPPLTQLLDDPDAATRSSAATALGDAARYGSIELAHQALMQLTQDKAARVRKSAFRALWMSAEAGGDLTPLIPALCETLRADPDQENRGEVGVVLGAAVRAGCDLGAFVPDLVAALADEYQRVRFYTARTLHYVAKGGVSIQGAVPALARTLLDKDQPAADWAVVALQTYAAGIPQAREVLETVRALDGESKQASKVIKACEKRLGVE
jgi:HEAT repeat protein